MQVTEDVARVGTTELHVLHLKQWKAASSILGLAVLHLLSRSSLRQRLQALSAGRLQVWPTLRRTTRQQASRPVSAFSKACAAGARCFQFSPHAARPLIDSLEPPWHTPMPGTYTQLGYMSDSIYICCSSVFCFHFHANTYKGIAYTSLRRTSCTAGFPGATACSPAARVSLALAPPEPRRLPPPPPPRPAPLALLPTTQLRREPRTTAQRRLDVLVVAGVPASGSSAVLLPLPVRPLPVPARVFAPVVAATPRHGKRQGRDASA